MFLGLDFASDKDSLDTSPIAINEFKKLRVQHGVFDEVMVDQEGKSEYSNLKTDWKYETVIHAKFLDNLLAGNVSFYSDQVSYIRIKRRKIEDLNNWITLKEISYKEELEFELYDYLNSSNQEYEYALIPILADGTEGDYITSTIKSEFYTTFIVEREKAYELAYELAYGDKERVSPNQVFEPINGKYPIVVSNGSLNYDKGNLSALIVSPQTVDNNMKIDPKSEYKLRESMMDFFTNKAPKLLKGHNGEMSLITVLNPNISYNNNLDQALGSVSFNWVEIGDSESVEDLFNSNLIDRYNA
ncbi:hypothetical protein GOQ27_15105 [Clostridium sp. D2Q-11]|uniref:Uncharacterized protein n=1 Tax=Anaeromonas frigoriresistens TaxID=2683708 RepID=A0A942UZD4_9FIRM|nr:hypothetical protein [Anaeromonas frigoriresistens]MBS4539801.1 hypothetical protein [Anaeromonas frigoriresistens]